MKGAGGKAMTVTSGCLGRHVPRGKLSKRDMTARAYSQLQPLNRKERRAQAKARKMMGDA